MRASLSVVLLAAFLVLTFQNCGRSSDNNFGVVGNTSQGACNLESKDISVLGISNGVGTFQLAASDVVQSEWSVDGVRTGTGNGRNFTYTFPRSGPYTIAVRGFSNSCFSEKYTAEKRVNVDVTGGGSCNPIQPQVTATPTVANLNDRVTVNLTNAFSFNTSSISWFVGSAQVATGVATTEITAVPTGNLTVTVTATQTACDRQESTAISVVVSQVGAPALTGFNFTGGTLERNSALDSVFRVPRNASVNLNFTSANTVTAVMDALPCGANCFSVKSAEASTANCSQVTKPLQLNGTSGATSQITEFFAYCPASATTCTVGPVSKRLATEACGGTPTTTTQATPTTAAPTTTTTLAPSCVDVDVDCSSNSGNPANCSLTGTNVYLAGTNVRRPQAFYEKVESIQVVQQYSSTFCSTDRFGIMNGSAYPSTVRATCGCRAKFRARLCTNITGFSRSTTCN